MREAGLRFDPLAARVRDGDREIRLSPLERAIVAFVGSSRRGAGREEIVEAVFPHLVPESAARTLKVLVHRIRRKVGSRAFLCSIDGRYVLDHCPSEELREVELDVANLKAAKRHLASTERKRLESYGGRIAQLPERHLKDRRWFEPLARRLKTLERDITALLAEDALRRGEGLEALDRVAPNHELSAR